MAQWFRVWHGLHSDGKFSLIAQRLNIPRGIVISAWTYLLELASTNDDRGDCGEIDLELASFMLGIDEAQFESILASFRQRKMLDGNKITKWTCRQPADATGAERIARLREKEKRKTNPLKEEGISESVTVGNGAVTACNGRAEQNRAEQIQSRADTDADAEQNKSEQKSSPRPYVPSGFVAPPESEPWLPPLPDKLAGEARELIWAFDRARRESFPNAKPRRQSAEATADEQALAALLAKQGLTEAEFCDLAADRWKWLADNGKQPPASLTYFRNLLADNGWETERQKVTA